MFPKRWDGSFPEFGSHVWNGLIENMAPMTCSHSPEQLKVSVLKSEKGEYRKGDTCLHWHARGPDLHGQAPLPPHPGGQLNGRCPQLLLFTCMELLLRGATRRSFSRTPGCASPALVCFTKVSQAPQKQGRPARDERH